MPIAPSEILVLKNGDRVFLQYDNESIGSVTAAGAEVSEVKFDDHVTRCISNRHLRRQSK
jgi:hypothetical protein